MSMTKKSNTLLSALFAALASTPAMAVVDVSSPGFDGGDNTVAAGETITSSSVYGIRDSYASDPVHYSAQGNAGSWFNFMVLDTSDVTINVSTIAGTGTFSPGMTVWSSGVNSFTGGSASPYLETSSVTGYSTPTSFNALSPINSNPVAGTKWMAAGHGGNMQDTLAYAMAGPTL
ncbi:hypothetical protein ACFL2V_16585, partial [Pseudomonadota bacterium]